MKLELKEINNVGNSDTGFNNEFNNFEDILNCFERQKNSFENIEKDLLVSPFFQILFTFSFFLFIHPVLTVTSLSFKLGHTIQPRPKTGKKGQYSWAFYLKKDVLESFLNPVLTVTSLSFKFAIAYFFQKFIKKMKLEFSFSTFISAVWSFSNTKLKNKHHKIHLYQNEKRKFIHDFFSFPVNKEIILNYLHTFYQINEYRLSSNVYSEIDAIKIAIENENYELAFNNIIQFKQRIQYIKALDKHSY